MNVAILKSEEYARIWMVVTPEMAKEILEIEGPNRVATLDTIDAYAFDMKQGNWRSNVSPICFDKLGRLRDGGHRIRAVVRAGVPVKLEMALGMSEDEIACLDGGRLRRLADKLSIFRDTEKNAVRRVSYLNVALLVLYKGSAPVIKTIDAYECWMKWFRTGVEGTIDSLQTVAYRIAPVGGAIAFAWAAEPDKCRDFARLLCDTTGRAVPSPVATVRNYLNNGRRFDTNHNLAVSRKILNAVLAHVEDRPLLKLADGQVGSEFFSKIYEELKIGPHETVSQNPIRWNR